ncbi:Peptidase A1 [Corchorus capsularis]|uniref:Peptidase A1 n=1 Tax=Corchorus capsularis TaxID=210143 RepID=A0A1R3JKB4_COCAP|nr:Peptidase A1 [Corchorus capsularis]
MHPFTVLFLIAFSFISVSALAPYKYKTLVAPIVKDPKTSLYSITLNSRENYVIDINAPLSWRLCQNPGYPASPVSCFAPQCYQARSILSGMCPPANNIWMKNGQCHCIVTPVNPVAKSCALARLTSGNPTLSWTNGKNPTGVAKLNKTYFSCAPNTLFKSLPQGVTGLAALSRAPLAFSSQLAPSNLGVAKKFAICLPSTNRAPGVTFFGDGPYNFGHYIPTEFDAAKILSYTPLVKKSNSVEYYIGVKGISINEKASKFLPNAFAFDSYGNGGVKLSTLVPYTVLRSDIYKTFLNDFSKATKNIPRAKNVSPFGLCVKASALGWSRVGLMAPLVEFELGNGAKWGMIGAHSMKEVGNDVACLAFVDGGKTAKEAVVIGSYQMENNLLQFDLAASRLGFGSLTARRSSCTSFNFTAV